MMNVLDKLPKRQQGEAKLMLRAHPLCRDPGRC